MKDPQRYIHELESIISATKRELERFRDSAAPDDLVRAAKNARVLYASERDTNDDRAQLLIAISEALLPFNLGPHHATILDKVHALMARWEALERNAVLLMVGNATCPDCNGRGWVVGDCHPQERCNPCGGRGYVTVVTEKTQTTEPSR